MEQNPAFSPPFAYHLEFQRQKDEDHLKLLAIFHYVGAGLGMIGIAFLLLHYLIFSHVMAGMGTGSPARVPPEFITVIRLVYLGGGLILIAYAVANFLSGNYLRAKKH